MTIALSIVCWFVASCIVMSFIEHGIHRYLMHKRSLPQWLYRWIPGFGRIFTNHNVLHHGRYYKVFNYEEDPHGRKTSIRLDLWIAIVGGALVGLALYPLSAVAGPVFLTVILLHHLAWNLIHEEMHNPRPRWFSRLAFFRFFARYHWMHHKYPGKNYNVILPGADFVFRKHAKPTVADRIQMQALGIERVEQERAGEGKASCLVGLGVKHEHHGNTI